MNKEQVNQYKELVEENILNAMKQIDSASYIVNEKLMADGDYSNEGMVLLNCKRELKRILNKKFDQLARQK